MFFFFKSADIQLLQAPSGVAMHFETLRDGESGEKAH